MTINSYLEVTLNNKIVRLPQKQILIISPERAGSTWLFDALRYHPNINVEKHSDLFQFCCLKGRRYPSDLSKPILQSTPTDYLQIETTANGVELIPKLDLELSDRISKKLSAFSHFAIEKWHPSFFEFDFEVFKQKLDWLERHINVKYILLSRNPQNSIGSFLSYQERNQKWNRSITPSSLVYYYKRVYDFLFALAALKNCFLVNYEDLIHSFKSTMFSIYKHIWGTIVDDIKAEVFIFFDEIQNRSNRQNRISQQPTPFFGNQEGTTDIYKNQFRQFYNLNSELIQRCDKSCKNLNFLFTQNEKNHHQTPLNIIGNLALEITLLNQSNVQTSVSLHNQIIQFEKLEDSYKHLKNINHKAKRQLSKKQQALENKKRLIGKLKADHQQSIEQKNESIQKLKVKHQKIIFQKDDLINRMESDYKSLINSTTFKISQQLVIAIKNPGIKTILLPIELIRLLFQRYKIITTLKHVIRETTKTRSNRLRIVLARLRWKRKKKYLFKYYQGDELYQKISEERRTLIKNWGPIPTKKKDTKKLSGLQNKYKNERIFLIGNGPSINNTPLEKLKDEYTFGVNRIYLLFDKISWKPTFYTVHDWRLIPDNVDEINALSGMTNFFPSNFKSLLREGNDVYWFWSRNDFENIHLNRLDITNGVFLGGTVMVIAIQIARYLGFNPIYLIGVDADYKIKASVKQSGKTMKDGNKFFLESTEDDDPNHFSSNYFGKGRKWHHPSVPNMLNGFENVNRAVEETGGKIYNAGIGGKLEVFERVEFDSLFY